MLVFNRCTGCTSVLVWFLNVSVHFDILYLIYFCVAPYLPSICYPRLREVFSEHISASLVHLLPLFNLNSEDLSFINNLSNVCARTYECACVHACVRAYACGCVGVRAWLLIFSVLRISAKTYVVEINYMTNRYQAERRTQPVHCTIYRCYYRQSAGCPPYSTICHFTSK